MDECAWLCCQNLALHQSSNTHLSSNDLTGRRIEGDGCYESPETFFSALADDRSTGNGALDV